MRNKIYYLLALVFVLACKEKQPPSIKEAVIVKTTIQKTKVNPAVLQDGASFLQIFSAYTKLGHWEELIKMTDKVSIKKYGREAIENKYKKINLAMKLSLKSTIDNGDSTYTLNYETNIFATKKILRATVRVLANDSVKLVIDNLNNLFE